MTKFKFQTKGILTEGKVGDETAGTKEKIRLKKDRDLYLTAGVGITVFHTAVLVISYIVAIRRLKAVPVSNNFLYLLIATTLPVALWFLSTTTDYWNYYNHKITLLYLVIFNAALTIYQPIYSLLWRVFVPNVFKIHTNPALTEGMIILLAQILIILCLILYGAIVFQTIRPYFLNKSVLDKIKRYKLKQSVDLRKDKEWAYDFKAVKDINTGRTILVKEHDRGVHTTVVGASGTGKTSSVFLTAIRDDLTQRLKNEIKRCIEMLKMILAGKAYLKGPWIHGFKEKYVVAKKGHEKELDRIRRRYKPCGLTVVAPDNSIVEDLIKLAKARHAMVNVIDPVKKWNQFDNVKEVKLAPFYIDPSLEGDELAKVIAETANNFSEVLVAINERNKKMEQYFRDISTSTSTNIAIVVMLANHILGKQTSFYDIQECVNDFRKIKPYVDTVESHFGFNISSIDLKGNRGVSLEDIRLTNRADTNENQEEMKRNPYYMTILTIKNELLGEGMEEMFDQARGLRMLLNKLLLNPRVREILTGEGEELFNFKRAFEESEITIINTAQEYGSDTSAGLGLFFLLLQRTEVLRRSPDNPSPHFLLIDEASQYMHSLYDDIINQYRKFGTYALIALQTLTQTEKNDSTKYLKQVFMNAGTQILFGRLSADEMKIYSEIAGTEEVSLAQDTITQNSIFSDNPNITTSQRITPTQVNKKEGSDLRVRDFQEVTIYTIDEGRVLDAKTGKVNFIDKARDFAAQPYKIFSWEKLMPKKGTPIDLTEDELQQLKDKGDSVEYSDATAQKSKSIRKQERFNDIRETTAPVMSQSIMNLEKPEEKVDYAQKDLFSIFFANEKIIQTNSDTAAEKEDDEDLDALLEKLNNIE